MPKQDKQEGKEGKEETRVLDALPDDASDDDAGASASTYLVPGLERGLRILAEFSAREPVLGAPELSKRIGIPRTTTFRLLQTLEALGFLERVNGDRNFRLGVAVLRLGFEYLSSLELTDFAAPVLERLRDATGLTPTCLSAISAMWCSSPRRKATSHVQFGEGACRHALSGACDRARPCADGRPEFRRAAPALSGKELEQFTDRTPATVRNWTNGCASARRRDMARAKGVRTRNFGGDGAGARSLGRIVAAVTATVPRSEYRIAREKDDSLPPCAARRSNYRCEWAIGPTTATPRAQAASQTAEPKKPE